MATFGEENEAPRSLEDYPREGTTAVVADPPTKTGKQTHENGLQPIMRPGSADQVASMVVGANVFILFDTSNYMYRGFVYAQDAIEEFVRSLDRPYRVAFYSYSRNVSRICPLTPDRTMALTGVRETVAGDDAALYDALLMTLKDASRFSGRRVIVAFSNGPDNASMVAPEDVRELAQTEGIPIYMISTQLARLDPTFNRGLRAHVREHRREVLFRQRLAGPGESLRFHSRRPCPSLHAHLLPSAESKFWVEKHQREA